jgi:arginine exporter protein ArgO
MQKAAAVVGVVFLLVGIAGFVPGLTTDMGDMQAAGQHSMAMLLGLFMVSVLHNVVHLLYGVAGLVASRQYGASRIFFLAGGAIYIVLWLYGLVIDQGSNANFVPVNTADNWLHFGLGVGMLAIGLVLSRERSATSSRAA